jgi:uncharacterized hydrophobic protein (TIGR00271 family)
MVHLRLVVPPDRTEAVLDLLKQSASVSNVVYLPGAATHRPKGDVVLCDVAREDASVILSDLRDLGIDRDGSIALETVDTSMSEVARQAEKAAAGLPSDAVVWEEVESRTSEGTELSANFLAFMTIATLIASVGIILDQPILIVGAMIVGPEFGPLAGLMVAIVQQRGELARRSLLALAVGFPFAIAVTTVASFVFKETGLAPDTIPQHPLTDFISNPDFFSVFVGFLAGIVGVLSLTTSKSSALIGVLVSVVTIPAAGNVGLAAAYGDWDQCGGALLQLAINLVAIVAGGVTTLYIQRRLYIARRRRHRLTRGQAMGRG